MSWLDEVVDANSENEAPAKFFYWAALSAISAVMRKNVYLDCFYYKLYPNIYVFLVASSGMKKGVPVVLAKTLVDKAGVCRIISGRNSMPRIIADLGKAYTTEAGAVVRDAQGFLVSGELAAFLVKDPDALTILTDIHDTHAYEKEWVNSLKGTGVDKLKSPCITLLGATNEDHFADAVPQTAIGGGFIARTFIVFSRERSRLNSLTTAPTKLVNTTALCQYLRELAKLQGEFQWTDAARDLYDRWYYKFMGEDHTDNTGTVNRIGDQIKKVAMLIALADAPVLVLKEKHVLESINVCTECITGMRQVTMGAGKANLASQTKLLIKTLLDRPDHQLERSAILRRFWGEMDHFDLDRIIETLLAADAIDAVHQGKKTVYILKQKVVDEFSKAVRSIQ